MRVLQGLQPTTACLFCVLTVTLSGMLFSPPAQAALGGETAWDAHTFNGSFSDSGTTAGSLVNPANVTFVPYLSNPFCPDLTPADNAVYEVTETLSAEGEAEGANEGEGAGEGEGETCTDPYMSPNVPQPVGNLGNYFSITDSGTITDLDFWVETQGVTGSVSIYLEHVDCWHTWSFSSPVDFIDGMYIFDDEATTSFGSCMGGQCIPDRYSLSETGTSLSDVFDGCNLNGEWMMTLIGDAGGQIVNWGICVQGDITGEGEGSLEGEGSMEGELEYCPGNVVGNPGFEDGNVVWTEFADSGYELLMNSAANSYEGTWSAFFGDVQPNEHCVLSQALTVPNAAAGTLKFYLKNDSAQPTDTFGAWMDDTQVFNITGETPGYSAYTQVSVDVSLFADGASHVLRFEGYFTGLMLLDNVCITLEGMEGQPEGMLEGEGTIEGVEEGLVEGEGVEEGMVEGEGVEEGTIEGETEGSTEGIPEGFAEGASEGGEEGITEGMPEGITEGQTEGVIEGEGAMEGEAEDGFLTADQDQNNLISLSELLRVIQFFNSDGFHCEAGTEDGYAPGPGDTSCDPYDSDYNTQDWQISLSELLRVIQFFNSSGYHYCPGESTEDGFCPGPA